MSEHVAPLWESYHRNVLAPAGAGPIQVQETRRAFYAGAGSLLAHMVNAFEEGDDPTEADLDMMNEIQGELDAFNLDVKEGRA